MDLNGPEDSLEAWLIKLGKPEWAAAIALRAALRVLPFSANPKYFANLHTLPETIGSLLRALIISASASVYLSSEIGALIGESAALSADSAEGAGIFGHDAVVSVADAAAQAAIIASGAAETAVTARHAAYFAANAVRATFATTSSPGASRSAAAAIIAADAAALAARAAYSAEADVWDALQKDCALLDVGGDLTSQPLWHRVSSDWFTEPQAIMRTTLVGLNVGFDFWIDWYDRRLAGRATQFALPRDADIEMSRRLVAQDDDWWNREPALVNGEIKGWLDELTPDVQAARLETILTRIDAGYQPNFSTHAAKAALETLEAAIADAAPQPGSNFFETDDVLPGDADPSPPALPPPPAIPVEVQAKLVELEEAVKVPQPDARKLGRIATWMKNKLEDWRTVSPKGMEKLEEEMGSSAAKLVRWGALGVGTLVIANLSGVLDALLSYLEAALAIVRPVIGP